MEFNGQVEVSIQDGELVFQGKVPGKVKRAIRKRFKTDKKFREDVEKQMQAESLLSKVKASENYKKIMHGLDWVSPLSKNA